MEYQHLIDAVQEFRLEQLLHLSQYPLFAILLLFLPDICPSGKPHGRCLPAQQVRPHIGGHDDHRVLEVHGSALAVRQPAILQHLQQDIEHIIMSFFNLIQQDDGIRLAPHRIGELTALFIAYIARRRSHQTGDRMLFHILRHIKADNGILAAKQGLGKSPGQLCFAHTCRSQEQEGTNGPLRILEPGPGPAHGLGNCVHSLLLAYHPLLQQLLHVEKTLRFLGSQPLHGDACPDGHHLRNIISPHRDAVILLFLPFLAGFLQLCLHAGLLIPDLRSPLILLSSNGCFLFPAHGFQLFLQCLYSGRLCQSLHPHLGRRLIHEIDGLVRQEPVCDVAVRQPHSGLDSLILDLSPVEGLIFIPDPMENTDSVLHPRLPHHDGLETALQRCILFNVFLVFLQRRSPDDLDLSTGKRRLQYIRRINRALCRTGTNKGMHLVDEQDHIAILHNLLNDAFKPFLKLAPVFCPGHQ